MGKAYEGIFAQGVTPDAYGISVLPLGSSLVRVLFMSLSVGRTLQNTLQCDRTLFIVIHDTKFLFFLDTILPINIT